MTSFEIDLFSTPLPLFILGLIPLLINSRKGQGDERGEDPDLFC